mmetsp:Transcript_24578/g.70666  ORF Transcript_24578/g.70666 Transcript_24578/m.70666 type:complete len:287 (-) Transcript_24578:822-1682(-)
MDILQLPATVKVDRVLAQLLDAIRLHDHLQLAHVLGEEVDVADPEPRLLLDHTGRPLLIGGHCIVAPDVPVQHVVHRLHEVQEVDARQGVQAPVRQPGDDAGASYVLAAADDVALVCPVLAACPHVLHREGAVAHDDGVLPRDQAVVHLVEHAVADLALELGLALVGLLPRQREVPWIEHDSGAVEDRLLRLVGLGHELPVVKLRQVDLGRGEPVLVDHVPLVRGERLRGRAGDIYEVHLLDVGAELAVGQDAVLLADLVEVLEQPVPRGPGRVEHAGDRIVLVEF